MFPEVFMLRKAAENMVSLHPGLVHVKQFFSEEDIEDGIATVYQFRKLFSETICTFVLIRGREIFVAAKNIESDKIETIGYR